MLASVARHVPRVAASSRVRCVGESTGLQALADKSSTLRRLGLGHETDGDTIVDAYAPWGFTVNGIALEGAVLLLPKASLLFAPASMAELTPASLEVLQLLENPPDSLLLGCGSRSARVPSEVHAWLEASNISLEALATPAACSTFNFMVQERRPVAAVLFPVDAPPREREEAPNGR